MLENITIDNVLKEYYHAIPADKLDDENIVIDETPVEDSVNKYIVEFCKFLRASYNRGYYISESILSKLMAVIDYEDYAYQVFMGYKTILENAMNDYVTEYKQPIDEFTVEQSINYINEYLDDIRDDDFEPESLMHVLLEVDGPITLIYNDLMNNTNTDIEKVLICLYVISKYNKPLYKDLLEMDVLDDTIKNL